MRPWPPPGPLRFVFVAARSRPQVHLRGCRQRKPKHYADMFIMTDQDTSVLANGNHQRLQGLCAPTDRCARSLSAGADRYIALA